MERQHRHQLLLRRVAARGHAPGQHTLLPVSRPIGQHLGGSQQQREQDRRSALQSLGRRPLYLGHSPERLSLHGTTSGGHAGIVLLRGALDDSSLGRFLSADSIVPNPGDPQAWDRYAYVDNNPVKFVDPSGHMLDPGGAGGSYDDLTFAEKWHVQNATMQSRIKNDYEDAGKLNSITDSLLSHEGPATGFLYFSWAVNNVIENLGQGSTALEQATIDLAIVGGSNLASGMMGLAAGGDVTPGVGSGNAYSVAYETTIPKTVFQYARSSHNYYANKALLADIKADPQFAQAMNELIPNLSQELYYRPNASPKGWTWHHVAKQPGVMQLIPRVQHESPLLQYLLHPGGRGGFSLWP
jgi:RHS repeat-associated protein